MPSDATRLLAGLPTDSPALFGRAMQRLARCSCYPVGATSAVSSHRARCADRALTGELPSMVQRNQRNHFLPPAMTTALPSGLASGDSLQPQHREYILYRFLMLVNPHLRQDGRVFSGGVCHIHRHSGKSRNLRATMDSGFRRSDGSTPNHLKGNTASRQGSVSD